MLAPALCRCVCAFVSHSGAMTAPRRRCVMSQLWPVIRYGVWCGRAVCFVRGPVHVFGVMLCNSKQSRVDVWLASTHHNAQHTARTQDHNTAQHTILYSTKAQPQHTSTTLYHTAPHHTTPMLHFSAPPLPTPYCFYLESLGKGHHSKVVSAQINSAECRRIVTVHTGVLRDAHEVPREGCGGVGQRAAGVRSNLHTQTYVVKYGNHIGVNICGGLL